MGESISWFAVNGLDKEAIYRRAHLIPTGATGDYAGGNGARQMRDGWTLIVLDRVDHPLIASTELQELSSGCDLVACNVEEHVMASSSEAWRNGRRLWHVEHLASKDISDLGTFGHLPENFDQIEREYRQRQAAEDSSKPEVDYIFDIPLKLAQTITGFKHDEAPFDAFELLEWRRPRPWWRIW